MNLPTIIISIAVAAALIMAIRFAFNSNDDCGSCNGCCKKDCKRKK